MEWGDRAKASAAAAADERAAGGEVLGGYVKVMTDEQMEVLRKQISIYATICEQLVEMHRALTDHQDTIAGRSIGAVAGLKPIATPYSLASVLVFLSVLAFCGLQTENWAIALLCLALGLALRLSVPSSSLCLQRKIVSSFFPMPCLKPASFVYL